MIQKRMGLTGNQIKILAIIFMTFNHYTFMFGFPAIYSDHTFVDAVLLPVNFLLLFIFKHTGPMTYVIMSFALAEGFEHTKNKFTYGKRLFLFALVSVIPFYLFANYGLRSALWMNPQILIENMSFNIIYVLFVSFIVLCCIEKLQNIGRSQWIRMILEVLVVVLGIMLTYRADWSPIGVLGPYIMFKVPKEKRATYGVLLFYAITVMGVGIKMYLEFPGALLGTMLYCLRDRLPMLVSMLILSRYNGSIGKYNLKYLFYIYYPVHLLIFFIIYYFMF